MRAVKLKDWIEEQQGQTDACLWCGESLGEFVAVEDGVCGICLATR